MAADGLDGLIVMSPANLHYLSGYYTFSVSNLTALVSACGWGCGSSDGVVRDPGGGVVGMGGGRGELCVERGRACGFQGGGNVGGPGVRGASGSG